MKKSRFTDEQKVKALRDADATSVEAVSKKLGVAEQTICLWRKKFRGQSIDEVREMKAPLAENARLKKLLGGQRKRMVSPEVRCGMVKVATARGKVGLQVPKRRRREPRLGMGHRSRHVQAIGQRLKCLTVVDEFTRECLAIDVASSIRSERVVAVLARLVAARGAPGFLRSDNGPEFVAELVQQWLKDEGISTAYITPDRPWKNGFNESFNGKFRDECLDAEWFPTRREAIVVSSSTGATSTIPATQRPRLPDAVGVRGGRSESVLSIVSGQPAAVCFGSGCESPAPRRQRGGRLRRGAGPSAASTESPTRLAPPRLPPDCGARAAVRFKHSLVRKPMQVSPQSEERDDR